MIWLLFVFLATVFWALADICNDACIEMHTGHKGERADEAEHKGLTGEQSAFINVAVTSVFVIVGFLAGVARLPTMDTLPSLMVCGCLHFLAYLLLLKAFEDASSTEITPLLQTSAVWVFIIQVLNNTVHTLFFDSAEVEFIRPLHIIAFCLIIVGGFLPIAHGNLREMCQMSFWRNRVVLLCVTSELLVAAYSVILHQMTYDEDNEGGESMDSAKFFIRSRMFASLCGVFCFTAIPSMRTSALTLLRTPALKHTAAIKALGDGLSIAGLVVAAVPYGSFYEPSIINAAEGGLQQMCNLCLATVLYRCGFGRRVLYLRTKIISAIVVMIGLGLSSTSGELPAWTLFTPALPVPALN